MGDPVGFLRQKREDPMRRPVDERVRDWKELYQIEPEPRLRAQAARCMDCGVPFCQGDTGCPVHNVIPDWNDLVYNGHWQEAVASLQATNNFPEFTGKLCPAPCESACVLGLIDRPVTIRHIEERIAEQGWENGWVQPLPPALETGLKVAVVGSGPAGLAAAQQVRRLGLRVGEPYRMLGKLRGVVLHLDTSLRFVTMLLPIISTENCKFRPDPAIARQRITTPRNRTTHRQEIFTISSGST